MASTDELKTVLKDTLENQGVLGQIRARVRAEVFNALDDKTEPRPTLSNENMLINELIREYLEFNNYKYTLSVLMTETGQPQDRIDRNYLNQELNISEDHATASTPLLYGMMAHFLQKPKKAAPNAGRRRTTPDRNQRENYPRTRQDHAERVGRDFSDYSDFSDHQQPGAFVVRGSRR